MSTRLTAILFLLTTPASFMHTSICTVLWMIALPALPWLVLPLPQGPTAKTIVRVSSWAVVANVLIQALLIFALHTR